MWFVLEKNCDSKGWYSPTRVAKGRNKSGKLGSLDLASWSQLELPMVISLPLPPCSWDCSLTWKEMSPGSGLSWICRIMELSTKLQSGSGLSGERRWRARDGPCGQ